MLLHEAASFGSPLQRQFKAKMTLIFWLYPLSQSRMAAIREELEARRGTVRIAD